MIAHPPDKPPDQDSGNELGTTGEKNERRKETSPLHSEQINDSEVVKERQNETSVIQSKDNITEGKSYSFITKNKKKSMKYINRNSVWSKIYLDWKDVTGNTLRGFSPSMRQYKSMLESLKLKEEDILRINDCKSHAGYIVISMKVPINVIEAFDHIKGENSVGDGVFFSIRGLKNLKMIQEPIEVMVKNGSEINLGALREIMERHGEIVGSIEDVPHKTVLTEEEDPDMKDFASKFNKIMSGRLKFHIKPNRLLPSIVPIGGKKVELSSSLQRMQCFKCLKFGHIKSKCSSAGKTPYWDFEREFREELGLPNRIRGWQETRTIEEEVRQEELEGEQTLESGDDSRGELGQNTNQSDSDRDDESALRQEEEENHIDCPNEIRREKICENENPPQEKDWPTVLRKRPGLKDGEELKENQHSTKCNRKKKRSPEDTQKDSKKKARET